MTVAGAESSEFVASQHNLKSMKSSTNPNRGATAPLLALIVCSPLSPLHAQTNGTWTTNGPGNWSDSANWSAGSVAYGATAIADFATLDITDNHAVTVNAPFTIGTLTTQDAGAASHDWTFDGTGPLTLDNGLTQPVVAVANRSAGISAPLAGTQGFSKTGAGALILSGNNSGLSGTMDLVNVAGTNNAGVILASNTAIGGITSIVINGPADPLANDSGQYLGIDGGVTLGGGVAITLDTQGGNNFPSGGIRGTGPNTEVATIEGPITITRSGSRIANNTARRLDLTGPITAGPEVTNFFFRFGKNEGVRIANALNSWTGTTTHSEDTLWFEPGALPLTTALTICGSGPGAVQTSGTFTRALGSAAGEVRFTLSANRAQGFGARGGDLTLNFGGAGAEVLFDTTPTTAPDTAIRTSLLVLNNSTADGQLTLANPLNLNGSDRTIQVDAQVAELAGGVTGSGGLIKTGGGTLLLSGAISHSGNTTVNGGTLTFSSPAAYAGATTLAGGTLRTTGGDNRLPTGTTLAFTGTAGTLDLTTTSQTLANLTVPNLLAASYAISGTALTLDAAVDRQFGPGGAVTSAHSVALDLSDLSSFTSTAPANVFRVGLKSGSTNAAGGGSPGQMATVVLADQNVITAGSIRLGDVGANNHGGTSTLRLGRVNTIQADSIFSGTSGRSSSVLSFDPGVANPTATFRNTDGTSPVADWRVGQTVTFNATTWTDSVDFSAGTVDALVNTLTVGTTDIGTQTGRAGIENASFTMGAGTLETTTLNLGRISGSGTITNTMAANGTLTLNHADGIVKAGTVTLAENTVLAGGAGNRSVSGTLNLTAGTLEATTIQRGAQSGNATATAAFNWTDGTLRNLTPAGLAIDSVPINLLDGSHTLDATGSATITVNASSSVAGSGGLTKIGSGIVSLEGSNTYTGPTDVQAGTLQFKNSLPASFAATVDAAATLALNGVTLFVGPGLDIDGTLALTGPVKIAVPATSAIPGSFPNVLEYGDITGAANLGSNYRNASISLGDNSASLEVLAGIPLVWTGAGGNIWDVATTVSWKDGSDTPQGFFWADSVTFDSAGSAFPDVSLGGEMRPAAVSVNEAVVDYVFSGPGLIAGTTGLTKDGAAKLTLATNNTHSGTTIINAGTLEVGNGGTTGSTGSGDIVNQGALVFNRSNNFTVANAISGAGGVTKIGAGVMTVTADNDYTGGTTLAAGAIHLGQQSPAGSLGAGPVVNDGQLRLNRADGSGPYAYTIANDISGSGELLVGQNSGGSFNSVATLTGANTFTGNITILSGGLRITSAAALGTGPKTITLTNGTNGRPQFYLDGSGGNITIPAGIDFRTSSPQLSLPAIGNLAGDNVIEGNFTLQSGGGNTALSVLGGSLTLNGGIAANTSLRNLALGGNFGAPGIINGVISNGSNPVGVIMAGPNTWTFTGSNSYTGTTTINGGELRINGDQSLATGTVTVNSGGTLGGTGTIGGAVNALTGSTVAPGSAIGTLTTTGPATLAGSLAVELDATTADRLDVGGLLDLAGATLDVTQLAAASQPVYIIASYGTLSGTFAGINGIPSGYQLDYDFNNLPQIALVAGADAYGDWEILNGIAGAGPDTDSDGDGVRNGIEFVIGGDPSGPNSDSNGLLPTISVDGTYLDFVFRRTDESVVYAPFVEYGSDLGGWTQARQGVNGVVVITENNPLDLPPDTDRVTVRIPRALAAPGTRLFARLRVNIP
jgi:autotransporter-associated beta strand protein